MRKRHSEERRRNKSPFTTYCTTTVACILSAACGLVFLMFGTDTVFIQVGMNTNSSNVDLPVSFEKTIREIEKDKSSNLGLGDVEITTGDPDIVESTPDEPYTPGVTSTPDIGEIADADIQADIAAGLYSAEDYSYMVALGGESGSYEGFYAVAWCVINRARANGTSIKAEVTKSGQFSGYHQNEVNNPRNEDIKRAAVAALRGGESSIGDSVFFFGRRDGHDLWAEPNIPAFYNIGNNVYYKKWGDLHNTGRCPDGGILIYSEGTWYYPAGSRYP